ncbi:MAG: cobalt ECF transporter T component CbiQ [Christensenellaceae bacterium]|jgi:cobalt/nickel transport system permease protein|nr:cobalt ECF transporter T component CbiQ [Christensenellaceae bacterium]
MKNADARSFLIQFETLALGKTVIHKLHPLTKLMSSFVFIIGVISFKRYDFIRLVPYLFYTVIVTALAEIPYRVLIPKLLIALPFCLFAGVSNLIFDRETALVFLNLRISYGAVSLFTILFKMYLSVSAALLLTATTPLTELSAQLRRLRVPYVFVMVFEMTFRYIGVFLSEIRSKNTAYNLRNGGRKGIRIGHAGSFLGQMLLHGFDRSERVYAAMQLRGYSREEIPIAKQPFRLLDGVVLAVVCALVIVFRFIKIW